MLLDQILNKKGIEGIFMKRPSDQIADLAMVDESQVNMSKRFKNAMQSLGDD